MISGSAFPLTCGSQGDPGASGGRASGAPVWAGRKVPTGAGRLLRSNAAGRPDSPAAARTLTPRDSGRKRPSAAVAETDLTVPDYVGPRWLWSGRSVFTRGSSARRGVDNRRNRGTEWTSDPARPLPSYRGRNSRDSPGSGPRTNPGVDPSGVPLVPKVSGKIGRGKVPGSTRILENPV